MTVAELIEQFNSERPNQVADETKVGWLRKCEQMIINEVLITHEHDLNDESTLNMEVVGSTLVLTKGGSYENHIATFGMSTNLYVPEPYDDLYMEYLSQRIAYNTNDTKRYNIVSKAFNNALLTYQQYVNRTYAPIRKEKHLFRHDTI